MDLMLSILRGAYCKSTHHYLALDALRSLRTERGKQLRGVLLSHHQAYLAGAKDPDTRFRDFHNHVIHVADGFWGGAVEAAEQWRTRFVESAKTTDWNDAAYALGVLSHYFMDPFQPLHTGQSPVEAVIHRPLEWSICLAYEELYQQAQNEEIAVTFDLGSDAGWLKEAIHQGARLANRYYSPLMAAYDMRHSRSNPKAALTSAARDILAEVIAVVLTGWSRVVDRMAQEVTVDIPTESLTLPTLVAGLKMPAAWVTKRIASASERRAVAELLDEFELTGTLQEHLPDEVRQVRATRQSESSHEPVAHPGSQKELRKPQTTPQQVPVTRVLDAEIVPVPREEPENQDSALEPSEPLIHRLPRPALTLSSPLVDAPSIGPKTARRFIQIGVETVRDFLNHSPASLAERLRTKWITAELVSEWQSQARLAVALDVLRGQEVQVLVGAGIESPEQLAKAKAESLFDAVTKYCSSAAGKRILRGSPPPTMADVREWIQCAAAGARGRRAA